jgi:hypothetical protein
MKSLRLLVLMMAVGAVPAFLVQAHGQQEVDPDHFDQAVVKAAPGPKVQANHKTAPSGHEGSHARLASRHSSSRTHRHQAHLA